MWRFLAFSGRLLLLGVLFLTPLVTLAWFQNRIENKHLRLIISIVTVDLSFFLCSFIGLYLDPHSQHLSGRERLITSLLIVLALTLVICIVLPLRKLASSLFHRFFSR